MGLVANLGWRALGTVVKTAAGALCKYPGLDSEYHIQERLSGPWPSGPYLWLHGASLGECRMLLQFCRALKEDYPDVPPLLVTSQKVEVVSFLRDSCGGLADVAIAPADVPSAMYEFVRCVQPLGLVLAENELWPGYLATLSRLSTRRSVALVSGRYRRSLPFLDFSGVALACFQTPFDLGRFARASRGRVPSVVGGDWKLLDWAREGGKIRAPENPDVDAVFLSFHQEESQALVGMAQKLVGEGKSAVLMPRRLSELVFFRRVLQEQGLPVVDYPAVQKGSVSLVGRFGLSKEVLSRSRCAVVGGSFVRSLGIHDFWEPLQMGVPTYVGSFAKGHEDAVALLCRERAVVRLGSASDFLNCVLPSADRARIFLAGEKKKVLDSYLQVLNFIKGLK